MFLASVIGPTALDVQAFEELRVLEARADVARDGQRFVEFAPTIETRRVTCVALAKTVYECRYETRLKEMFNDRFGEWESRQVQLEWRRRRWALKAVLR